MENLNAEQIKKALKCCITDSCFSCPYDDVGVYSQCVPTLLDNALALINSQEQQIAELTEAFAVKAATLIEFDKNIERLTEEKERLLMALANYDRLTDVRIAEEYYTAEDYEELREENERLRGERAKFFEYKHGTLVRNALVLTKNKKEFDEFCEAIKADTVRGMIDRITEHATNGYPRKVRLDVIDQIAKEMLEGEK